MKKRLLLTGNTYQYHFWLRENGFHQNDVQYVHSLRDLDGLGHFDLVLYGAYMERFDFRAILERARQMDCNIIVDESRAKSPTDKLLIKAGQALGVQSHKFACFTFYMRQYQALTNPTAMSSLRAPNYNAWAKVATLLETEMHKLYPTMPKPRKRKQLRWGKITPEGVLTYRNGKSAWYSIFE